jgi:hypothetical protein
MANEGATLALRPASLGAGFDSALLAGEIDAPSPPVILFLAGPSSDGLASEGVGRPAFAEVGGPTVLPRASWPTLGVVERGGRAPAPAHATQSTYLTQVFNLLGLDITATNGAIVFVGPDGQLTANTGDATGGGIVALDSAGSTLNSSTASVLRSAETAVRSGTDSAARTIKSLVAGVLGPNHGAGKTIDIEGFEDHSVNVVGNNQIVTNDDSNVFVGRDGLLNANTGDTDSSGLIAVDVTDSVVTSGPSGDDDGEDGDDPDEDDDRRASEDRRATTDAVAGTSRPSTTSNLSIHGDGFDDVSMHAQGNGNVVTADDSNIVIGGTGQVNAQIGDADTGGVIVMGVHRSQITSGCAGDNCAGD